jgi:hypothetical protein
MDLAMAADAALVFGEDSDLRALSPCQGRIPVLPAREFVAREFVARTLRSRWRRSH